MYELTVIIKCIACSCPEDQYMGFIESIPGVFKKGPSPVCIKQAFLTGIREIYGKNFTETIRLEISERGGKDRCTACPEYAKCKIKNV